MNFDELNEKNHLLFAIKFYENPHSVTIDDFLEDMKKFKYLKRLLKRYLKTKVLRTNLILNHLIVLYNVFGDGTLPLLMYKLEPEYWSAVKTFLVYLSRYPDDHQGCLRDVQIEATIKGVLDRL